MTRNECPKEYFEHLVEVVRSVFAAEHKLRADGVLSKEAVKGKSAQWYCEKVAEELISKTDANENANEKETMNEVKWYIILTKFYMECCEFWRKELTKQGYDSMYVHIKAKQNAKQDLANLQHNPYKPQGEQIPNKVHLNFMQTI